MALGGAFAGVSIRFGRTAAPTSTAASSRLGRFRDARPVLGKKRTRPLATNERPKLNLQVRQPSAATSRVRPIQNINLTPNTPGDELDAVLSPDGRYIVFASNGEDSNGDLRIDRVRADRKFKIWTMDADGSKQRPVTSDKGDQVEPAWAPSGNRIAYASNEGGDWDVYIYTLPSGPKVKLSLGTSQERHPTWSPGADRVAFMSDAQNGINKIWAMRTDGTQPQMLSANSSNQDMNPAWAPDGQSIAFQSDGMDANADGIIDGVAGVTNIWLMSPGGTMQRQMTGFQMRGGFSTNVDPSWIADGSLLIFASDRQDTDNDSLPDSRGAFDAYAMFPDTPETAAAPQAFQLTTRPTNVPDPLTGNVRNPAVFPDWNQNPKVLYTNDQTGNQDVWTTSILDITAPQLEELPTVTPKQTSPGGTISIRARVSDYETGMDAVYAQIRDPDDEVTDAAGQDHKVYYVQQGTPNTPTGKINVWTEVDAHMVNAVTKAYEIPPYQPPIDDFSFLPMAPSPGWLQLFDDGQHGDGAAGDGVFANTWQTPTNAPSDFYVDIIAYDQGGLWKIYDGVAGFTTEQFAARSNLLLVMDYAHGQKFMQGMRSGYSFYEYEPTWFPVESYYTHNPTGQYFFPGTYLNNVINSPGAEPAADSLLASDGLDRFYSPEAYDLWRVVCRGPVTPDVMALYGPRTQQQPDFTNPFTGAMRDQVVADRGILWVSPYAGDLWVGPGSIVDTSTQANLADFVGRGGRLIMTGQDTAWALTRDGQIPSSLLDKMGVQFVDDASQNVVTNLQWPLRLSMNGVGGDPLATQTWGPHFHANAFPDPLNMPQTFIPSLFGSVYIGYRTNTQGDQPYTDGAGNQYWIDSIAPIAPAVSSFTFASNIGVRGNSTGDPVVRKLDPLTGARTAFFSFGIEGVGNEFVAAEANSINQVHSHNYRNSLLHNALCWTRTGTIHGTVQLTNSLTPKAGVLVRVIDDYRNPGTLMGQAFTQADGSYVIEGLPASIYLVEPYNPGFVYDHAHREPVHGGGRMQVNIKISEAPPGSISGHVTGPDGITALADATVTATLQAATGTTPVAKSATTDQYGNYTITELPNGDYTAKCSAAGFPDRTRLGLVTVQPGGDTPNINFTMGGSVGSITGTVTRDSDGAVVAGATVELRNGAIVVATATTDTVGTYAFVGVGSGTYELVITGGPGILATPGVSVTFGGSGQVRKDLVARTGATTLVAGTVRDSAGNAIAGATVDVLLNGAVLKTTQSTAVQVDGTRMYNYKIVGLAAGTYEVRASKTGTQGGRTRFTINQGDQLYSLDLLLDALHIFPSGLAMVASPFDYSTTDMTALLGLPAGAVKLATYNTTGGGYAFYPQGPADRLRPGVGYFMQLAGPVSLSQEGRSTDSSKPYSISLGIGWNMIGNPFPFIVNWFDTKVKIGAETITLQEAIGRDLVKNALWTYANGQYRLAFQLLPWEGYWVKATQPVTLLISNQAGRSAEPDPFRARRATEEAWTLQLVARAGSVADASNYLGVSGQARDEFDPAGDVLEPPAAALAEQVQLTFPHRSAWGGSSGDYAVDLRSAVAGEKVWEFEVSTTVANADVEVTWPNAGQLPKRYTAILEDVDTGARRYLRTTGSYVFRSGADGATRRFRLQVTTKVQGPLVVSNLQVAPKAGRGGGAVLSFDLSEPAAVRVKVLSAAGRTVQEVISRQVRAAGSNSVPWDGRDSRGAGLSPGLYFYQVEAAAEDGRSVQQMRPFMHVR